MKCTTVYAVSVSSVYNEPIAENRKSLWDADARPDGRSPAAAPPGVLAGHDRAGIPSLNVTQLFLFAPAPVTLGGRTGKRLFVSGDCFVALVINPLPSPPLRGSGEKGREGLFRFDRGPASDFISARCLRERELPSTSSDRTPRPRPRRGATDPQR
jgi:hypothetical protein